MALTELLIPNAIVSESSQSSPLTASESLVLQDQPPNQAVEPAGQSANWSFWSVFGSTFVTIFLAELGDKTQIATLLMSAESHDPWVVFSGAASALVATSLIGVMVGRWLCTRLSPKTLEKATGMLLLLISLLLFLDAVQL